MSRFRALFFTVLRWTPLPWLLRHTYQRRAVTVLTYHNPAPDTARRHFRALARRYRVISLRDLERALRQGRFDELPPRALVLTLDDGLREVADLEPVCQDLRLPLTVFLCSGIAGTGRRFWFTHPLPVAEKERLKRLPHRERLRQLEEAGFDQQLESDPPQALSSEQIARLSEVMDFQAHTRFHPCLPTCEDAEAWEEIEGSRRELEQQHELEIYSLAYPNGDYGPREAEMARRAGFRCAVTTDHGVNRAAADPFLLRRISMNEDGGTAEAIVTASGLWGFLRPALVQAFRRLGYASR
ncbi:MAG: polysaccharide deacetylase family protein [Acidobacteriota bacterium]|nr:polysaccharide deacetylase family protein [Acidobacteriota bacterium]